MAKKITIREYSDESFVDVALDTILLNKQAIVFVNSKKSAESSAEKIAAKLKKISTKLNDANVVLEELSEEMLHLPRPTKQCEKISALVKKGIAFHHAGLTSRQKELIEDNFRLGNIKIICSTPTLAAGVDLPAFRTIIKDVKRFNGRWGMDYIAVLEYLQQAGRAGRPGKEEYGESIIFADTKQQKNELFEKYIQGEPEEIYSKLAVEPVLRTYVLSLIATGFVRTKQELIGFFEGTFYAKQFKDLAKLEFIISKMIELLEEYKFITRTQIKNSDDKENKTNAARNAKSLFLSALSIEQNLDEKLFSTPLGKRVAELYIDPFTANQIIVALNKAQTKKQRINSFSFLQIISHTLELRPLIRAKQKDFDELERATANYEECFLEEVPPPYDEDYSDFLSSVKTALFFEDWINEFDEEALLEKYDVRPGEIKVKLDNADWLLYSAKELSIIIGMHEMIKELNKLRLRVQHGAKEELLTLLKIPQVGRVRARKLHQNGIKSVSDLRKAEINFIGKLIGKKIAENIKRELNESIENNEDSNDNSNDDFDSNKKAHFRKKSAENQNEAKSKKEKQGRLSDF